MVFSSIIFLLFFIPIFLLVYYCIPNNFKNTWLVIASLLFYSWGAPTFLPILLVSCTFDFYCSLNFNNKTRKIWLTVSIISNIALLVFFKYSNFILENVNSILFLLDGQNFTWQKVILPIGISFLTFQKISYLIDVYRKDCKPQVVFIDYLLFITLFPHSIAGPIVRYKEIQEQLTKRFSFINKTNIYLGLNRFIIGLSKKVLLANVLGLQADLVFKNYHELTFTQTWVGALCYTFQIYLDFSGYSDMAIGLAKMMGFKIPENFNFPYTSKSVTEFWKRWHITLSSWMKDYLYIPLGGNKVNNFRTYINLFLVFLFSGFWHGASWNFVIWGAFHGLFLIIERLFLNKIISKYNILASLYTFLVVLTGWVFFRADNLHEAITFLQKMFTFSDFDLTYLSSLKTHLIALFIITLIFSLSPVEIQNKLNSIVEKVSSNLYINVLFYVLYLFLFLLCLGELFATGFNPFIYFKF